MPSAGHNNHIEPMTYEKTLRGQLCQLRRDIIARLNIEFDATMLSMLADIDASINAIDAEAAESNASKERYRGD